MGPAQCDTVAARQAAGAPSATSVAATPLAARARSASVAIEIAPSYDDGVLGLALDRALVALQNRLVYWEKLETYYV